MRNSSPMCSSEGGERDPCRNVTGRCGSSCMCANHEMEFMCAADSSPHFEFGEQNGAGRVCAIERNLPWPRAVVQPSELSLLSASG